MIRNFPDWRKGYLSREEVARLDQDTRSALSSDITVSEGMDGGLTHGIGGTAYAAATPPRIFGRIVGQPLTGYTSDFYLFVEANYTPTDGWVLNQDGRQVATNYTETVTVDSVDYEAGLCLEINGATVPTDSIVELFPLPDGQYWGFSWQDLGTVGEVREVDGSPSLADIGVFEFDQTDGFVVSAPSAGVARIDIQSATATQAGIVDTADQTWAGVKTHQTYVVLNSTGTAKAIELRNSSGEAASPKKRLGIYSTNYLFQFYTQAIGPDALSAFSQFGVDGSGYTVFQLDSSNFGNTYSPEILVRASSGTNGEISVTGSNGIKYGRAGMTGCHTSGTDPHFWVKNELTGVYQRGATATVSGLVFAGGLYISGSFSGGYTDEQAQDAVGTILTDSSTIDFTYSDPTPSITAAVIYQMSITADASGLKLSGDSASPGNSYFYGTNGSGTKGWYATSTISGSLDITGLTANDIDVADEIPNYDSSATANRKITVKRLAGYCNPAVCDFGISTQRDALHPTTNRTSQGTLWLALAEANGGLTPSGYGRIALYDGTRWNLYLVAGESISLSLTLTSATVYDVFVYDNSGTITLETLAWTSATGRATALAIQDGVLVKSGATTRRYMGTIYAVGTNITEDSVNRRFVWNYYHRARRYMYTYDSTDSWNYTTATWRSANNSAANKIEFVQGLNDRAVSAQTMIMALSTSAKTIASGIGVDSTSVNSALLFGTNMSANQYHQVESFYHGMTGIGYHFLQWLEYSGTGGTTTWYGDGGVPTALQGGITGWIWG